MKAQIIAVSFLRLDIVELINFAKQNLWMLCSVWIAMSSSVTAAAQETPRGIAQEARLYRQKGYEAQQLGSLETAMSYYQKAILADASYATPYNDLGVIYEALGQPAQAKQSYAHCLALNPNCLGAYSNLATLYEKQGDLQTAVTYWQQRAQLGNPDDPWTQQARQHLNEPLAGRPADVFPQIPHEELSPLHNQTGTTGEMIRIRQEKDASEQKPAMLNSRAALSEERSKQELANAKEELARVTEALTKLQKATETLQAQDDAHAKELTRVHQEKDALEQKLTAQTMEQAALYHDLGVAYTQLKIYPKAIEAYEKSLSLNPQNPQAHYHLGLLYKHIRNDAELASRHLRTYLETSPNATDRQQLEALLGLMQREKTSSQ